MGVSTKYLQKYLNWFRSKEMLKGSANFIEEFTNKSLDNFQGWNLFKAIPVEFEKLIQISTHN